MEPDARELKWAKRFEKPLLIAAALVIPVLVLQIEKVGGAWETVALVADYGIWFVFASEVVVMLAVTTDRKRWARSHVLEIVVTLLTPPFLLAALEPFQVARLLRLVRLLRLAPLVRKAFTPGGLKTAGILGAVSVGAGALIYNSTAGFSIGKGFLISGFAILAGNTGPTKVPGPGSQIATLVLRIIGIAIVAFFTGALAERFVRADLDGVAKADAEADAKELENQEMILAELKAVRIELAHLREMTAANSADTDAGDEVGAGSTG